MLPVLAMSIGEYDYSRTNGSSGFRQTPSHPMAPMSSHRLYTVEFELNLLLLITRTDKIAAPRDARKPRNRKAMSAFAIWHLRSTSDER